MDAVLKKIVGTHPIASHFQQHFKPIFKSIFNEVLSHYKWNKSLLSHYKWKHKESLGTPIPRVPAPLHSWLQGRSEGGKISQAESLWGRRVTAWSPKSPNNVTSAFFNTINLLLKDFRLEHGGAKLASCPGRHLTSLRPARL